MRAYHAVTAAAAWLLPTPLAAQMQLPRDLEIQVAKSALPAHLRDGATVYVLEEPATGYAVAQAGSNSFHALASRVEPAVFRGTWEYTEHFDDVLLPIASDAAGARSLLQPLLDAGRLIAGGRSPAELKREMASRFESRQYRSPDRPGVATSPMPTSAGRRRP